MIFHSTLLASKEIAKREGVLRGLLAFVEESFLEVGAVPNFVVFFSTVFAVCSEYGFDRDQFVSRFYVLLLFVGQLLKRVS